MKRFFVSLALLVAVIASTVFTSFAAVKKLEESKDAVLLCTVKEKNDNLDSLKIKEAIRVWDKNKKFICAVSFYDDFSEIEGKFTELEFYSENPDFEKSSKISYETGALLEERTSGFYVTLENIF